MSRQKFLRRIVLYLAGLYCLALGVAFSINSNLGVSPVNSLPYVLSLVTGKEVGTCVTLVFSCYLLAQMLILRREFRWMNLLQILLSMVFGYFVTCAKWMVGTFTIPTYGGQLCMLFISVIFVAAGVCLYMNADLIHMPMEGLTHVVSERILKKLPFHDVKVMMDTVVVLIGIGLSLVCLGGMEGIREGTVICALTVGKVMKPMQKMMVPMIRKLCF